MGKAEIMSIAKKYAELVREKVDNEAMVYLFGSAARGEMHPDSDIDIAVVSKTFDSDICKNYARIAIFAGNVSWDIEPHAIRSEDMVKTTPFTKTVMREGVLI
jgi:predicted nucleotidyltransferase